MTMMIQIEIQMMKGIGETEGDVKIEENEGSARRIGGKDEKKKSRNRRAKSLWKMGRKRKCLLFRLNNFVKIYIINGPMLIQ